MADPESTFPGQYQKVRERGSMFSGKQLEELKKLFGMNSYLTSECKNSKALKTGLPPRVVQIWFKNRRTKARKSDQEYLPPKQEAQQQHPMEEEVQTSPPPRRNLGSEFTSPDDFSPGPLVYTQHRVPSFQLSLCPSPKKCHTGHLDGHQIIHFDCCQDSNIYYLHPLLHSQQCPGLVSNKLLDPGSPRV
ncbi:PREDICTED: divergent paired-related homeobox-like [Elephantulus edwardii]|uniref:divergent paired-related homeobox-like n=1 Tax=Elephantulus edwardii TaxID=28737 RepID=UPI0003F0AC88|nr:PREDICTED: divergent paired-related homeobox-like [Elephantulus edwardii]